MKLVPHSMPTKLSKVDKFANRLPTDFGQMVKIARTLSEAIWSAKNVATHIKEKGMNKVIGREKRNLEGSSKSNKTRRFLKFGPMRIGGGGEAKWYEKHT